MCAVLLHRKQTGRKCSKMLAPSNPWTTFVFFRFVSPLVSLYFLYNKYSKYEFKEKPQMPKSRNLRCSLEFLPAQKLCGLTLSHRRLHLTSTLCFLSSSQWPYFTLPLEGARERWASTGRQLLIGPLSRFLLGPRSHGSSLQGRMTQGYSMPRVPLQFPLPPQLHLTRSLGAQC